MTRSISNIVWGFGLLAAALVLGKVDSNAIPWAVATLGAIVLLGSAAGWLTERDRDITAAHAAARKTTSTPGATDTP